MLLTQNPYKLNGAYHWRWYARRTAYIKHVNYLRRWVREKNTINIQAGDGLVAHVLGIRGIENDPLAVKLASEKGVTVDLGDSYNLPYKDGNFDSALLTDSLEHMRGPVKALSEIHRVIKNYLYITTPREENLVEKPYYRYWKPDKLVALVEKQGFKLLVEPRNRYSARHIYFKFQKA